MIKSNDIRLGNLIEWSGNIHSIDSIDQNYVSIRKKNLERKWILHKDVKPIKLTNDWIDKFGLRLNKFFYEGNGVYWCTANNPCIPVQFVHELQNLFYTINGDKKELKIIKDDNKIEPTI